MNNLSAFQLFEHSDDDSIKYKTMYSSESLEILKVIEGTPQSFGYEFDDMKVIEGNLRTIFSFFLQEKTSRIICPLNDDYYKVTSKQSSLNPFSINELAKGLNFSFSEKDIDTNYYELTIVNQPLLLKHLRYNEEGSSNSLQYWYRKGTKLEKLAEIFEIRQKILIKINENGDKFYELKFEWKEFDYPIDELNNLLRDRYGLQLDAKKGSVKFYIFEKI